MGKLDGKVAIVTGGAGGIGLATAKLFAEEGASVMIADISEDGLAKAVESIGGERVATKVVDVASAEDVASLVADTVDRFGGLDVYIANAGIEGKVAPIADYPVEEFDRVLAVNLRGSFLAIQSAAPAIAKRGGGSIVVTSSVAGLVGATGLGPYCASKHGVMGLVKTAAAELAPMKIRVNTLNPGPIANRMMESIESQANPEAPESVHAMFEGRVPMGRYGTNEEMARIALFLASDDSSYCTGTSFVGDGGYVAQ
jgi:NAD(P)-dependent dehydrogenase (short-subunit alcohol dehydrogenase family)